jgi:diguanylate cyclase (GGDEF)-like protein
MPRPIRVAAVWLAAFVLVLDVGTAAASAWGQLAAVVGSAALVAVVVGFLRASERDQFLSVAEDRLVRLFTIGSAAVAAATIIQLTQIGLTRPRAAVLVDLDGFKQINDSLGHRIGDAVLRRFGEALRGRTRSTDLGFRLREQDIAARYGGDDFAVVLPHTPKMGAAVLAERLRAMFDGTILHAESGAKVTLSIGVAAYPETPSRARR